MLLIKSRFPNVSKTPINPLLKSVWMLCVEVNVEVRQLLSLALQAGKFPGMQRFHLGSFSRGRT